MTTRPSSGSGSGVDPAYLADISAFLFDEAARLDRRDLDGWLALYAEDATYSVPQGEPDPEHRVGIAYDDRRRLAERVIRLRSGFAYAQEPPSTTVHLVGNLRVTGEVDGCVDVESSQLVTEVRRGRQNLYAALVEHRLRPTQDTFSIVRKRIRLANSELPLGNLTFLI